MVVGRTVVAAIPPGRTRVRRMEVLTAVVAGIPRRHRAAMAARAAVITEAQAEVTMAAQDRTAVRVAIARDRTEAGIAK
jgi:hypothetical protein